VEDIPQQQILPLQQLLLEIVLALTFCPFSQAQFDPQLQGSQFWHPKDSVWKQLQGLHWQSVPHTQREVWINLRLFIE